MRYHRPHRPWLILLALVPAFAAGPAPPAGSHPLVGAEILIHTRARVVRVIEGPYPECILPRFEVEPAGTRSPLRLTILPESLPWYVNLDLLEPEVRADLLRSLGEPSTRH